MTKVETHVSICGELAALYERKNHDYGDAFKKNFDEFGNVYPIIHLSEKLDRLKTLTRNGDQQVHDESIDDTLMDLANYAIMTIVERRLMTRQAQPSDVFHCIHCVHQNVSLDDFPCRACKHGEDSATADHYEPMGEHNGRDASNEG